MSSPPPQWSFPEGRLGCRIHGYIAVELGALKGLGGLGVWGLRLVVLWFQAAEP